ncbi:DUF456 domain-containing protein [Dehalobacterium formicoaceticum]|uniref:DUF456 domain-containing protein n=1 Tax=Dehalobacterium formicoaceticum TaxID=51515 RepID=A0ABT1Y5M3_9FIRM|nr:DUF456 domain-containing protein [Dehalobacterium formicoaceticum]MCR6546178.1 DUF456 domain-containing protein [Dehalobacterium formicoaceticum]
MDVALVVAVIFFVAGLLGTVLPVLPGAILIFAGMLIYGFMTRFAALDVPFFILQGLIVIIIFLVDYIASAAGTKRYGGSKQAAWGSVIGTILGVIILGPIGIIIGPFVGAVVVELIRGIKMIPAVRAGFGTIMGILGGTLIKIGAEIIMIVYFFMRIS